MIKDSNSMTCGMDILKTKLFYKCLVNYCGKYGIFAIEIIDLFIVGNIAFMSVVGLHIDDWLSF